MCYTEKGLNKLISYIKSGRANSLEDASQLYVDGVLRKYNWLLRGAGRAAQFLNNRPEP